MSSHGRAAGRLAVALLCAAWLLPGHARAADFQSWTAVLGTAQVADDLPELRLWLDTHLRRGEDITTVIARPAMGYTVNDWLSVWLGYAWVPVTLDDAGDTAHEHRGWQQVIASGSTLGGALALQARTRFEQRFLQHDSSIALRVRQFARAGFRPGNSSMVGLSVWDELFWGLTDTDLASSGYDQNRLFAGPAVFVREGLRIEGGYLFVHLDRKPVDQVQHVFALNLFVTL